MTPIALTIAGSDSGGGAGVQADLKAFSARGVYGASVITAITAQNTRAVTAVEEISPKVVAAQIEAVLDDLAVGAIKIGMLSSPEIIRVVAEGVRGRDIPVVLDPVMVAKSGDALLKEEAVDALAGELLPLADLLTPNLPEAARLLGTADAESADEMERQGRDLLKLGPRQVLMKGGHGKAETCTDLLLDGDGEPLFLTAERIQTRNTHGTGCTLSSAIAAEIAKGEAVATAVMNAHLYLQTAIRAADGLTVGSGHGPVHHFHEFWPASGDADG